MFHTQTVSPAATSSLSPDFAAARFNMVEGQLRPNQVTDPRILDAMGDIPRELFVPSSLVGVAYLDGDIPLIGERALMPPMVLARLLQAADIRQGEVVLDLAPATGYSTMVLTRLTSNVLVVEPDALLHKEAETNVAKYAKGKATVLAGAPVEGCISYAPFNAILINGSVDFVPQFLLDHLAEGGRLVAVIRRYGPGRAAHAGQACLYRKNKGTISEQPLFDANLRPAPGFTERPGFSF